MIQALLCEVIVCRLIVQHLGSFLVQLVSSVIKDGEIMGFSRAAAPSKPGFGLLERKAA
jgi:hypothetical protein